VTARPDHDALRAAGCSPERAQSVQSAIGRLDEALRAASAATPVHTLLVPGRIEVFGKHTDYCGGESLLCAVDRGFTVRVAPRRDAQIRVFDLGRQWDTIVPLAPTAVAQTGSWGNYVATVARRLATNFPSATTGCDIAFDSDLPSAAGLSSSSALIIACAKAIIAVNGLEHTLEWTSAIGTIEQEAAYLGCVENGADFGPLTGATGVGTFGGSEDHAAILGARAGAVLHMAFAPSRRLGVLPLPTDLVFVIGVSGVVADKTGSARARYNAVSALATQLVERWRAATGAVHQSLADILRSAPTAAAQLHALIDDLPEHDRHRLRARLTQFEREITQHIPAAVAALRAGDIAALGAAADASHADAASLLGNAVAETSALQRLAREHGAVAASAFGAGFGGSVWALVPRDRAPIFARRWLETYRTVYPARAGRASTFVTEAGPALQRW
jgi:galactokinase